VKNVVIFIIIIITVVFINIVINNCKWVYTHWKSATMQERTIQYSKGQYNTITHITHIAPINIHHSKQPSICPSRGGGGGEKKTLFVK
jgi:hypothetical protein